MRLRQLWAASLCCICQSYAVGGGRIMGPGLQIMGFNFHVVGGGE